ncbi:TPA: enoyl-CoA hydratase/isomerase [Pseudomonas aeruginosa]|nr:enoyl-CoA hydratase/isomerase [Pseudomonas aeruginosa]
MIETGYYTLRVRHEDNICFVQLYRPEANNTIDDRLVAELADLLERLDECVSVLVLEGLPQVFCFGMDFALVRKLANDPQASSSVLDPATLYDLWLRLTTGPFVVLSYVRGKVNAGGVGFVAASDIVIADQSASFSLSELLFGLMPACVLPFLERRIGPQRAHYMTLMTNAIGVDQALAWGLVDACEADGDNLLRKHLLRLRRLSRPGVAHYKQFRGSLYGAPRLDRDAALAANRQVFSDPQNLSNIVRYVETGALPWEQV